MNFEIITTPFFTRDAKPLVKKYPSLKEELLQLQIQLSEDPVLGEPLGKNCFKIRLSIASKGKGKSGGARIITCVKIVAKKVFLLAIYDKSKMEEMNDADLEERLTFLR